MTFEAGEPSIAEVAQSAKKPVKGWFVRADELPGRRDFIGVRIPIPHARAGRLPCRASGTVRRPEGDAAA